MSLFPILFIEKPGVSDQKNFAPDKIPGTEHRNPALEWAEEILLPGIFFQCFQKFLFRKRKETENFLIHRTGKNIIPKISRESHPPLVDGPGEPRDSGKEYPTTPGN
jgi:hypothetical protein